MRRLLIPVLAMLCALPVLPSLNLAYAEPSQTLYTCIFPDGPFAGQEILVRYDAPDAELSLVSNNTGETVQMLEAGLNTPQFEVRGWSSDCRYMIATLGVWGEQQTAAWDVVENRRVGTFDKQDRLGISFLWIPTNDYRLLIESASGAYIWHLPTNTLLLLNPYTNAHGHNFELAGHRSYLTWEGETPNLVWDLSRNQLLAVPVDPNRDGVVAYDLYTGQEVAFYALAPTTYQVKFRLFSEGQFLLVFANSSIFSEINQLTMFDRVTGSAQSLAAKDLNWLNPSPFMSTSGRYLLIKTWRILVWDLQNLDEVIPHQPTKTLELYGGRAFAHNIIAVRTNESDIMVQAVAFWYGLDFTIWQWDLATGERFYAKKYLETVCDDLSQLAPEDDVELVMWACGYR